MAPEFFQVVFPGSSLPFLNALSQVDIVIYMFLAGLSTPRNFAGHGYTTVVVRDMA